MKIIIKDPLFHFIVLGFVLFIAHGLININTTKPESNKIIVTQALIKTIKDEWETASGRAITTQLLEQKVQGYVRDEAFYREALRHHLERNDIFIKQHLVEKYRYMIKDSDITQEPSDQELNDFLQKNKSKYILPERVTFKQIVLRKNEEKLAQQLFIELKSGKTSFNAAQNNSGTSTDRPRHYRKRREDIEKQFGSAAAKQLFTAEPGFLEPIRIADAWHIFYLESRSNPKLPALNEIHGRLRLDWLADQRSIRDSSRNLEILDRYNVEIEGININGPVTQIDELLAKQSL